MNHMLGIASRWACTFTVAVCCVPIHGIRISIVGIPEAYFGMLMNVMET